MKDRFFIDTNIFIYSFDQEAPEKRDQAQSLIRRALHEGSGRISYQVVQEFLNVARHKFKNPLRAEDLVFYLETVLSPLCDVFPSLDFFRRGVRLSDRYGYSTYDSLIIAAAIDANCSTLYSEDLQHGQTIQTTTIINPFLEQL